MCWRESAEITIDNEELYSRVPRLSTQLMGPKKNGDSKQPARELKMRHLPAVDLKCATYPRSHYWNGPPTGGYHYLHNLICKQQRQKENGDMQAAKLEWAWQIFFGSQTDRRTWLDRPESILIKNIYTLWVETDSFYLLHTFDQEYIHFMGSDRLDWWWRSRIYIIYGVGYVSFTASQTSDWNHNALCKGIKAPNIYLKKIIFSDYSYGSYMI